MTDKERTIKSFNHLTSIEQLLDWVSEERLIEDRRCRLEEVVKKYPTIKEFFRLAMQPHDEFSHLDMENFPAQRPAHKIPNRQELGFEEFFLKNLKLARKEFAGRDINKRARLIQMLDFMDTRDFRLIVGALAGKWVYENKRINPMLVQLVLPDLFPKP